MEVLSTEKRTTTILKLKKLITEKTEELSQLKAQLRTLEDDRPQAPAPPKGILDQHSISRFSRQLILPELGPRGQLKLQAASVLIVGCGGLGCPLAEYLAAAGIGKLGLVDYDTVELSNLHRQVLHTEEMIGHPKTVSIANFCKNIDSRIECQLYNVALNSIICNDIIKDYDIIADCTDNVATRYLLNDACVLLKKPLVSGAALRFEGQLTVYNYQAGPCYRCLFPVPPPPETVTNCSDGGVLGVIPGVIGVLQALEVIKIATSIGSVCSGKMIMFDAMSTAFRTLKLRGRQSKCNVCGDSPTITELIDYEQFCGAKASDKEKGLSLLSNGDRISVDKYQEMRVKNLPHLLIDVRLPVELEICTLTNVTNIPINTLLNGSEDERLKQQIEDKNIPEIVCLCHKGNDSQRAVMHLKSLFKDQVVIRDVAGGLASWSRKIDPHFPVY